MFQERYFSQTSIGRGHGMMHNSTMNMHMSSADLLLLDTNKTVIADTSSDRIGENKTTIEGKTSDLIINGQKVGTLLLYQHELQNLEKGFILSSNLAIIGSGLIISHYCTSTQYLDNKKNHPAIEATNYRNEKNRTRRDFASNQQVIAND